MYYCCGNSLFFAYCSNNWFTRLTLKSTDTILNRSVEKGCLIPWTPTLEGDPCVRTLFVSARLNEYFDQKYWTDVSVAVRYAQLSADFDRFVTGEMLSIGWEPYQKGDNAFMARIDPVEYGIWSIRSVAPKPALRVFGAFYKEDVFVALSAKFRTELDGPGGKKWANAREDAIAMWEKLLPAQQRLIGGSINDFITEKKIVV